MEAYWTVRDNCSEECDFEVVRPWRLGNVDSWQRHVGSNLLLWVMGDFDISIGFKSVPDGGFIM